MPLNLLVRTYPTDYLDSPAAMRGYLEAAFEDGDPALSTVLNVVRALGLKLQVAPLPR